MSMAYVPLAVLLAYLSPLLVTNLSKNIDYFLLDLYERGISSNVLYFYQLHLAWVNWQAISVPATGKLRQESSEFESSLVNI